MSEVGNVIQTAKRPPLSPSIENVGQDENDDVFFTMARQLEEIRKMMGEVKRENEKL